MKKSLTILFFAIFCITSQGNDSVFYGNFLAALENENPYQRVGLIIEALEKTPGKKCDHHAIRQIKTDWKNFSFDEKYFSRLIKLLDKYPGDTELLDFCVNIAMLNLNFPADLLQKVEIHLPENADLNTANKADKERYYQLIYFITMQLIADDQTRRAAGFIDQFAAKYPRDMNILYRQIEINRSGCFRDHDTAPGLKDYDQIGKDDFWKKRLQNSATRLKNFQPANATEAIAALYGAIMLDMPQLPEMLLSMTKKFPDGNFSMISAVIAGHCKQKKLYIPDRDPVANFSGLIISNNIFPAKRMLRKMEKNLKNELEIILKSAQKDYSGICRMIRNGEIQLNSLGSIAFNAVIAAAEYQKDRLVIKTVLEFIEKEKVSEPSTLNAAGYVAAVLNIELEAAEKYISRALEAEPLQASYHDSMAWVLFRQGRVAEAEKEIMLALKYREPDASTAVMFLHAAEIKAALKKTDEAKLMLAKAKKIYDPDDPGCDEYDLTAEKKLEKLLK